MFKGFTKTSLLNFLVMAIMVCMIAFTMVFIYSSLKLKDKITFRVVQHTELVSELLTRSASDLMSDGHNGDRYTKLLDYGNHVGIDKVGIFRLSGEEAFVEEHLGNDIYALPRRKIRVDEKESFARAIETSNSTGYFNYADRTYSRYVPLKAEGACVSCHTNEGEPLGVLQITLSTTSDFELLGFTQRLIRILGIIALLPVVALLVAWAVIKEKNKLYGQLVDSNANLKNTYNELDKTRNYLQLILDNSKVLIVTTDTKGLIVEFNKEAESLLEYTKEELESKDVLTLYDSPTQRSELLEKVNQKDQGVWEARNREVVLKSKSGKTYHVIITLSTMVDGDGRIIGTVGVGKDISEQKMLQFKLLQSEKLAGIGTLASGIAHEINNPLAAILGMAEAIRDEDDLELIRSYTDDIIRYCVNANKIVRELSIYSRSGHAEQQTAVDLSTVIKNSLKMARHSASRLDVRINSDLGDDCLILANQVEMQQIFVNLIVNAIQAMSNGGGLTLHCRREGTFVVATVADTGPGIKPQDLPQIFDPFFTTKPVGKGTGLGLYVVYRLVTKHGGSIDVDSGPDKGCRFNLKFPYAVADETLEAI